MELINGDCLTKMKDLSDNSVDILITDLPYAQTSCKWDILIDMNEFWAQVNRVCKLNCPMFFCCSTKFGHTLINSNPKQFRYDLVWIKSSPCGFLNAKKMPMKKHEMIYVFYRRLPHYDTSSHRQKSNDRTCFSETVRGDVDSVFGGVKRTDTREVAGLGSVYDPPLPTSLLEFKSEKRKHPTQKPVSMMSWILKYYSKEGDTCLDPTMGSGTTGVACKQLGRKFVGIEMDAEIFKIAVGRINACN
tara:strand:- start:244 stop:981 length:738 start_codon:yes stop_codon:yes gene_type:complete